ncbi:pyridoxamine 5'-phosphate oxidase family protein [Pontixanthobacter aestiaquae]|uniref:General stress protein n=1 Tax=Pontixanthobacter aestiaquae TaxID=1509367 RepID=A0A844ZC96_9SPHN|nr:pyridoxamine 5'-phosphate oxidase family protein [Pontixanthobacter aestiaquae]MDN3645553.1 pyridoxamine 5'-phosphate oxidase family protein [Pontixanthobacter aestiaquae]MXO83449.1 general stress protein [Pontixanthobacter aestiaquae]
MKYTEGNTAELKSKFWESLADSPFVFLQLDNDPDTAVPMTAQLDKDADSSIWFFTTKDSDLAKKGPTTATFASKDHDIFARFEGVLTEETSRERLNKHWSNFVEAWFPGGKDDPNMVMLRMDLGLADIWSGDQSMLTTAKMALGMDVRDDMKDKKVETAL